MCPVVSIVIPAFNAERWIEETLLSATQQRGVAVEVIVVDDGSTDGTEARVRAHATPVRYVKTHNRGVSAARATGTRLAEGKYIKYLDADDLLTPGSVQRQYALAEQSGADVVYGNWQRLEESSHGWAPTEIIARTWQDVSSDPEIAFFTNMWAPTAAYLWSREFVLDRHPGWHIGLPVIQDARFALDAARAGAAFLHAPHVEVLYRTHRVGSVSTTSQLAFLRDAQRNGLELEQLWRKRGPLSAERKGALLEVFGWIARTAFPLDRALCRESWAHLQGLEPGYIPGGGTGFRALTRLAGYETAESIGQLLRRSSGSPIARR